MKVKEKVKVKKTVMKKEVQKKKPERASKLRRAPSGNILIFYKVFIRSYVCSALKLEILVKIVGTYLPEQNEFMLIF